MFNVHQGTHLIYLAAECTQGLESSKDKKVSSQTLSLIIKKNFSSSSL